MRNSPFTVQFFTQCDINNNTVTVKQSSEQDRQGTESTLTVAQTKHLTIYISENTSY